MKPTAFDGSNRVLGPPAGREAEVASLPVFSNGHVCVSCWELTEAERAEIFATGRIWLFVWAGHTQPPVSLQVERPDLPAKGSP